MRVLVACEFSQVVTKAFRDKGHEAYSCDLLPTEGNPDWHIQDDVLKHLNGLNCPDCKGIGYKNYNLATCPNCGGVGFLPWDMMIAHPPCTYLSRAGIRWIFSDPSRKPKVKEAADFFNKLLNADIKRIAVENPLQHRFAREYIRKPNQRIEPYMFGHKERKNTYLWLENLPFLSSTAALWDIEPPFFTDKRGHHHYWVDKLNNSRDRSRTFPGIAKAMAEQWA